jgi:hypothetical protein
MVQLSTISALLDNRLDNLLVNQRDSQLVNPQASHPDGHLAYPQECPQVLLVSRHRGHQTFRQLVRLPRHRSPPVSQAIAQECLLSPPQR